MNYKITALRLQKRNRQRVNVYLDGEFVFGLARIVAAWLTVGQEISDEKIVQLKSQDELEAAYQRALHYLNFRPRTESELRQYLSKQELPETVIGQVLERLSAAGLLNDARFAENWVDNRSDLRPRSKRALAYELKQRGINQQIIEQSIQELDDEDLAYQAALKQARKYQNLEWQAFRQKLYGFLGRRGFNYEVSASVSTRVWAELHSTSPEDETQFSTQELDPPSFDDNQSNYEVNL